MEQIMTLVTGAGVFVGLGVTLGAIVLGYQILSRNLTGLLSVAMSSPGGPKGSLGDGEYDWYAQNVKGNAGAEADWHEIRRSATYEEAREIWFRERGF